MIDLWINCMFLSYAYSFMILIYILCIGIYIKKHTLKFITDPVFWILFATLYYLLIPNYSLFRLNPLNIIESTKITTDIIILIFSVCIFLFSILMLTFSKIDYNKIVSFKIKKVTYQMAIIFYIISFLFFSYCYIVYFPQMIGITTLEKKEIFSFLMIIYV